MGTLNIKGVGDIKKEITASSSKGFGYFMKNASIYILVFVVAFILTNPEFVANPKDYFENFSAASLGVMGALFAALIALYQIAKSIMKEDRKERSHEHMEEYEEVLKKREHAEQERHAELVKKRFEIGPLISNELKNLLINTDADRAAILEMHNGTNNASGLPFIYGDMVYEEKSPNVGFASDEFKNFNLAKLPFVSLHYADKTWIGGVDEIEKEDAYLAAKLRMVEVNFGAFVILEGINGPLGFLTLFFKSEKNHPTKAKIIAEINHSSQILSTLLDKTRE